MQVKKSIFNDDPPINPPSMSAIARRPAALAPFMLPPYWMRTAEATSGPTLSDTHWRMLAWVSCAISGVAVSPAYFLWSADETNDKLENLGERGRSPRTSR